MECASAHGEGHTCGYQRLQPAIATTSDRRLDRALGRQRLQSCPLMDRLPGERQPSDVQN